MELQIISTDIETLVAEPIHQPKRMEALLTQLNQVQEKLQTYEVTKDTKLEIEMPTYKLQFQCVATPTTDTNELFMPESSNPQNNTRKTRSSNKQKFHPYAKASANGRANDTRSNNDEP
jgi:hypothetical protein